MLSGNRRICFEALVLAALGLSHPPAAAQEVRLLVQSSPLAGFAYHQAPEVWRDLRVGDRLELEREPGNAHDAYAVRVAWQGKVLGYVPRRENRALAWAMDRGEHLEARISRVQPHRNPRRRIQFEVYVQ